MEKIEDMILENLKNEKTYNEEIISKALKQIERLEIKKTNFFSKFFHKRLDDGKIIYVRDFFNLTIREANIILKIGEPMIKYYIGEITTKIEEAINKKEINKTKRNNASTANKKILLMINNIKENETIANILKKEILYEEKYNDLSDENKTLTKPFYYSALNLNNYELSILKKYLLNQIEYSNDEKFLDALINIYNKLMFFIKKLEYKSIIDKKYYNLEELNLQNKDIKTLNRMGIYHVSDLIDLKNAKKMKKYPKKMIEDITIILNENGIIIPDNLEQINEILKKENKKEKRIVK